MHWFKHDTDANQDAKLQNVLLDYGLEGYGLYWYCIELIAGKVDKDNIKFELEHDARILARNTGSTPQKVEEMMKYFVKAGLFECSNNTITCLKLAKRLDKSMTSNTQMREIIGNLKSHDGVMTESEKVMQDKIRLDKKKDSNTASVKTNVQHQEALDSFHEILDMLPKVHIYSDKRKTMVRGFFKKRSSESGREFTIENLRAYFGYIKSNCTWMLYPSKDFAGNTRKPRDFDYVMSDRCYIAVKEQRHDDIGK